jgi:basic membrane lipoprotein Med (substrate-binding protein (PBP1-ABC) superfamily)
MSRRLFVTSVAVSVFALMAGCAQQESGGGGDKGAAASPAPKTEAQASAAPVAGTLKVGLITVSPITDKGWSQTAYDGLQKIKGELGAQTGQPVEKPDLAQVEGVLRNLAQDGNQLILGNGSEYDDAAKRVAPDLENATVSIINGRSTGKGLMPIQFQSGQATYLAGMLAAGMSKTGKVACVGPQEIPIIKESFAAFEKGAKAVRPDVDVRITFIGNDDIAKGKQQAQALLDGGVDVIMGNANTANQGIAQAVTEKGGAMFIGANSDQSDLATPKNLGSFILDVPNAMVAVARNVKEGKNAGQAYRAGVADKAVGFKFNPGFKGAVPDDLKKKVEQAEADMASGKLTL